MPPKRRNVTSRAAAVPAPLPSPPPVAPPPAIPPPQIPTIVVDPEHAPPPAAAPQARSQGHLKPPKAIPGRIPIFGGGFMSQLEESFLGRIQGRSLDHLHFWERGDPDDPNHRSVCRVRTKIIAKELPIPETWDSIPTCSFSSSTSGTALRKHMLQYHPLLWLETAEALGWHHLLDKYANEARRYAGMATEPQTGGTAPGESLPTYSKAELERFLVQLIVANDLSIRLVDVPEFRRLCRFINPKVPDTDIPHRTKMRRLILEDYQRVFAAIRADLKRAVGRISFTTDLWSSKALAPFLGLTAHYMVENGPEKSLELRSVLIAFHPLDGKHDAKNLAKNIIDLTDRVGVSDKFGWITSDNASVNIKMMRHIADILRSRGVDDFDPAQRRIGCLPHILHICVTKILKYVEKCGKMPENDEDLDDIDGDDDANIGKFEYDDGDDDDDDDGDEDISTYAANCKAESRNPLGLLRKIIRTIRRSGEKRRTFRQSIVDHNDHRIFPQFKGKLPLFELLRDVATRWDSTFRMIARALKLRPAIDYMCAVDPMLQKMKLTSEEWSVLYDLGVVLLVPWTFTPKLCAEQVPTLTEVIKSFERFLTNWEDLPNHPKVKDQKVRRERIARYVRHGLTAGNKYYRRLDDSDAYAIAQILNPHTRMEWIDAHWDDDYKRRTREVVLATMEVYNRSLRDTESEDEAAEDLNADQADESDEDEQGTWFDEMSLTSAGIHLGLVDVLDVPVKPTTRRTPAQEFDLYCKLDFISANELLGMEIFDFWHRYRLQFPILYKMAMDYLPIQASSVPCERAFSSCAETDTKRRNRLSTSLIEALQVMKAYYRSDDVLDFVSSRFSSERELSADYPDSDHLLKLADGSPETLDNVIAAMVSEEGVPDTDD